MTSALGGRDDAALAAAALAGEDRAFTELMRRHKDGLYRFIRRYVGDADEAYDLLQEAFVAAWAALASFDPDRPMPAWLRAIALNKCRDWSRRRKVRRFFFTAESIEGKPVAALAEENTAGDGTRQALLDRLDAAIATLPRSLKEPLLLTAFEGLSHRQAGAALGLSAKAVETRVYRAKQALSQILNPAQ